MEKSYAVTLSGSPTGKVTVQRRGLYYLFSCRCSLYGDIMYQLMVTCGSVRENLGILVPQQGIFVLNRQLPVKRIGEGDMSFILVPKQSAPTEKFIPICPEEPFAYISRLKESFLVLRNGQPGIGL